MPGATRLAEAIANDEEHVAQIVAYREQHPEADAGPRGPRLSEYDAVVERLDSLIDEIRSNTLVAIAAGGGRPPKFQPQQRPQTAFDMLRHRRRSAQHEALTRRILRRG